MVTFFADQALPVEEGSKAPRNPMRYTNTQSRRQSSTCFVVVQHQFFVCGHTLCYRDVCLTEMIPLGKQGVFYEEVEFELCLEGQVSVDMRAGGRWASQGD